MGEIGKTIQLLLIDHWPITVVTVAGLLAVYFLLPRPKRYPVLWGTGAAAVALLVAGVFLIPTGVVSVETILFYLFSAIAVIAGGLLVTQENPARAALSFALVVLSTCGLFLLQAAPFLMAATTIVYAGAIVVTFLFVLMLAQQEGPSEADARSREPLLSCIAGFVLLGTLLYVLQATYGSNDLDAYLAQLDSAQARLGELTEQADGDRDTKALVQEANDVVKDLEELRKNSEKWMGTLLRSSPESATAFDRATQAVYEEAIPAVTPLVFRAENNLPVDRGQLRTAVGNLAEAVGNLVAEGEKSREMLGVLQPAGDHGLSSLSGPPANEPLKNLRRDEEGRPQMPHENTAYLGRALFSDYLLAVELAGTLLLVATVGAIAIAQSRREKTP